ncbi:hypothetical protein [Puia dinghuensis]|uniref:Uncharacterized protein n=1 Tax=Puia dinghuensis TaxID=1792502 RepID=A0A8J2XS34_9BACT|nr:hypothetical protein [Puia dinghuensis]GGA92053.1 hypothetical protein GCM10011511_14300 [Puia dinghuensis]
MDRQYLLPGIDPSTGIVPGTINPYIGPGIRFEPVVNPQNIPQQHQYYMHRFWFEFDIKLAFGYPPGIGIGCGVTATSYEDALGIIDEKIFSYVKRPPIKEMVEDVDINTLDQGHIIPNMKSPMYRGIWFPLGYD